MSANKIVGTPDDAYVRIKDFVFSLEDVRMKSTGALGSVWVKTFIFERDNAKQKDAYDSCERKTWFLVGGVAD